LFVPGKFAKPYNPTGVTATEASATRASKGPYPEGTPYGVFYVHGRRFNGFHVRFRDIARGGMRLVTPASVEQLAIESARHFDEAHALATAQQLKNKDIPEGGSKCVILVDTSDLPPGPDSKGLILRKSVKSFTDAMLDLIVRTPETEKKVVDLLGKQELIYLGPDEQVIPQDINWIVSRAAQRGYTIPSAFMSSKAAAGINHKVYGVTSEGVQVFLDVALKEMLMHPAQTGEPFTVKMTGGPDGDVAGNMIKILRREYGDQVKVVGLADATGCAEDPGGLDMDELMRLVRRKRYTLLAVLS
jgi:glutamate dehydrogenase